MSLEDGTAIRVAYTLRKGSLDGPVVERVSTFDFILGDQTVNDGIDELARSLPIGPTRRATVPAAFDMAQTGIKTEPSYLELSRLPRSRGKHLNRISQRGSCSEPIVSNEPLLCNPAREAHPDSPPLVSSTFLHRRDLISRLRGGFARSQGRSIVALGPGHCSCRLAASSMTASNPNPTLEPRLLTFKIVCNIGDASPRDALEHWLDYVWEEGGNLPGVVAVPLAKDTDGTLGFGEGRLIEKLLLPSPVKERLVSIDRIGCTVKYAVSNAGLLTYQVSEHHAIVTFARNAEAELELCWTVRIRPLPGWEAIVKSFTEASVSAVARNFQSHRPVSRVGIFQLPDPDEQTSINWGAPSGFRSRWLADREGNVESNVEDEGEGTVASTVKDDVEGDVDGNIEGNTEGNIEGNVEGGGDGDSVMATSLKTWSPMRPSRSKMQLDCFDRRATLVTACATTLLSLVQRASQVANAQEVETIPALISPSRSLLLEAASAISPLDAIDWNVSSLERSSIDIQPSPRSLVCEIPRRLSPIAQVPKRRGLNAERMSDAINDGLREQAWFVTGRGLPAYFSDTFTFSDPDGSIAGYEAYCRQVRRLFDQQSARCEVICCSVTAPNTITVVWRARYGDLKSPAKEFQEPVRRRSTHQRVLARAGTSGKINLGSLSIELKPYVVTTTLQTDPTDGLVVSQRDDFDFDGPSLLAYQLPPLRPLLRAAPTANELRQMCDFDTCHLAN
eukprot:CAMPEP_0115834264 /NCGR_PEP_ID=MMETSP0287-20121206/3595_1 /TAXON_ID=412157 /ORGANISM="Chrysochromulina rotalis, Strain UIO044" /LENGTH=731 /DNA_ID=CAMNT_0003287697 /DNA_START=74 /DNA_END=2271 /DNA_ORIENTATION=+